jgi:hypothetical protein
MHISDIDGEYIPRKGDRVRYQVCPMPPRFDKPQVNFSPCQRSLIKTFQNEANTSLISKITLKFFYSIFG